MIDIKDKFYRLCDEYAIIRIGIPVLTSWSSFFIIEFITKYLILALLVCVMLYAILAYHTIVKSNSYMRSIRHQELTSYANDNGYMIYTINDKKE